MHFEFSRKKKCYNKFNRVKIYILESECREKYIFVSIISGRTWFFSLSISRVKVTNQTMYIYVTASVRSIA
jgi:hypothetical protein